MSQATSVNAYQTLEALRTFEKRHAERDITSRVFAFTQGGKTYAVSSNGWSMLAVSTKLISDTAARGLKPLPETYATTFFSYFAPTSAHAIDARLKDLRGWCGTPKFRRCPHCEQGMNVARYGGNLFDRAIDRNLIAMALAFGDEDGIVAVYPHTRDNLAPIVFRHEHFLAVVMPMRESTEGMPVYPERDA
jgi:hypothetical protein